MLNFFNNQWSMTCRLHFLLYQCIYAKVSYFYVRIKQCITREWYCFHNQYYLKIIIVSVKLELDRGKQMHGGWKYGILAMRQICKEPDLTLTTIIASITFVVVSIGYTFKLTKYFFIRIARCIMGVTCVQHHKRFSQRNISIYF